MIFQVIKKPLVVWLWQVIHQVVIQNPVRNEEGLQLKKWLLLDEDITSTWPSEKAPPQSPKLLSFRQMGFHFFPYQIGEAGEKA